MNIENSLIKSLTSKTFEIAGDLSELTLDQFIDNSLLKEIPFFSIFYKSTKTVTGIRDTIFEMKVYGMSTFAVTN